MHLGDDDSPGVADDIVDRMEQAVEEVEEVLAEGFGIAVENLFGDAIDNMVDIAVDIAVETAVVDDAPGGVGAGKNVDCIAAVLSVVAARIQLLDAPLGPVQCEQVRLSLVRVSLVSERSFSVPASSRNQHRVP